MKNLQLIRSLYRLSCFLLYSEGAVMSLVTVVIPIMITVQSHWSTGTKTQRIEYDTTLSAGYSFGKGFAVPVSDQAGRLIKTVDRTDSLLIYYSEDRHILARIRLDSLRQLLYPNKSDTVSTDVHRQAVAYQRNMTRQIDSVLAATPDSKVYRLPDRWLLQHEFISGIAWSLRIPLYEMVSPQKNSFYSPLYAQWQRTLSYKPYVYLHQNLNNRLPFMIEASVFKWSDLHSFIWPLVVLSVLWVILLLSTSMLITYWFREIFATLLNGDFFGERIARRVQQSGWLFVGGFMLNNIIDIFQPFLVQRYLQTQGFNSDGIWNWSGPDHWFWLSAGLIMLVFAQIFRYGAQLQRESELTI